jgi:hypothetical protein
MKNRDKRRRTRRASAIMITSKMSSMVPQRRVKKPQKVRKSRRKVLKSKVLNQQQQLRALQKTMHRKRRLVEKLSRAWRSSCSAPRSTSKDFMLICSVATSNPMSALPRQFWRLLKTYAKRKIR